MIEIFQLKAGIHHYDFEIKDSFFQLMGTTLIEKGNLRAEVILDKNTDFFKLNFLIKGHVNLTCDRSLEEFEQYIDLNKSLIIRYGDKTEEVSDDLETITSDTLTIDLGKYIYEYIGLEIPYKKLHPKFREQVSLSDQDPLVYQTETYRKSDLEDDIDPRWKALLKLKDN
ncbi:MAG: DUF177 domain-containing protein [Opitutaceae bacterium]|nr:DUF177 domain-containing protein [Cytophagales bacterium]